jgi:hypothetical protein
MTTTPTEQLIAAARELHTACCDFDSEPSPRFSPAQRKWMNRLYSALAAVEANGPLTDSFFPESEWLWQNNYQFRLRAYPLLTARCLGSKGRWVWSYGDNPLPFHPQTTRAARKLLEAMGC